TVALVGLSGAGKSTLCNLISHFYSPFRGKILLDGLDLEDIEISSLRKHIGIVTQETILFNDTVTHNIAYGKEGAHIDEVIEAAKLAYAHDFIEKMPSGYSTMMGERGVRLSGGEKQRISIARALLKNPSILILDEATSDLDSQSEAMVQKALDNLLKQRTTFVIAHRLSTITKADKIVVMEEGKIKEIGTHQELLKKNGTYQKLYDIQFRKEEKAEVA
ncbi:MAG: ATP-binding cassette domain-containing protein, partial [Thermodesulfobacteriota bacterium]|nr:ATP-binding cassette domain-containing protein [Thermodesulfobacteriota bacterium]